MVDALSRISMGSIAYSKDGKKELVKEVHHLAHLGVKFNSSNNGGVFLQHGAESYLVVVLKGKQDMDPTLVKLNSG